jgi:predicted HTH transcriptional regulator
MDPNLWRIENFEAFLEARRQLIAQKYNEFMNALIYEPVLLYEKSIADLIALGESATLEFKSTLRWDVTQNQVNKDLQFSALKTIAAFLNSSGGTLVIGVEDNGAIFGLERDLQTLKNPSWDVFQQTLMNLVFSHLGPQFTSFIKVRSEDIVEHTVCVVDVDKAPQPAFMDGPRGKEFFVRMGNTTRSLDPQETTNYIQVNWE